MDEEEKVEDVEQEELQDKIQDIAETTKESANLAKNISTGNAAGAAKNTVNLLKNKKIRKRLILKILIPIIIFILIVTLIQGIFNAVGDKVQEIISETKNFFSLDEDGAIVVTDEQVDKVIDGIENLGISIDGLKLMGDVDYSNPDMEKANRIALRKYIREFYEAQAMTQTLNTNPSWVEEHIFNNGKPYGTVYVYRTDDEDVISPDTPKRALTYIPYKDMEEKQKKAAETNNVDLIKDYFSVDEEGKIVYPSWTRVIETVNKITVVRTTVHLVHQDYKNAISQYTTPMNFFLYLGITTRNPEFVSAVTDLVKKSRIEIVIIDTKSSNYTKTTNTYTLNTKTVTDESGPNDTEPDYREEISSETITKMKETTVENRSQKLAITYVRTWFCEQKITYYKNVNGPNYSTNTATEDDEPEPSLSGEGSVSWKTNQSTRYDTSSTIVTYEEGIKSDVEDKTGEKGDKEKSFIGLLDVEFKIPNSNIKETSGGNLVSSAELLFYLLEKDSSTQNLEQIMKFILYKYTGRDYGVKDLNFNIFDAKDFVIIGGVYGSTPEEKVWYTLREAGYSEYAVAGVMGNIYRESGFRPEAIEGGSGWGFGLCQWTNPRGGTTGRRQQLEAYAASKGVEPSDLDTQIEFLLTEITPGAEGPAKGYATYQLLYNKGYNGSKWENASSPAEAAIAFCWTFERPKIPGMEDRIEAAERYYVQFQGKTRPTGGALLDVADQVHRGQMTWTYSTGGDLYWNNIEMSLNNPNKVTCCATYVSSVIYAAGYASEAQMNSFNYNYCPTLYSYFVSQGWQIIQSYDELEAGDIVFMNYKDGDDPYDHVQLYAGDDTWYNAGSTNAIQRESPYSQGTWARKNFYVALRPVPIT